MAPGSIKTEIDEEPRPGVLMADIADDLLGKLSHEIFKHDCLDRRLKRHHITGRVHL